MQCVPKNNILEVHLDTLGVVRKLHGLDAPGAMGAAVDQLEEWVRKQSHFKKKDFSRHYLEVVLLSAKGSMERARARLERGCVQRSAMPQYFGDYDLRKDFQELDGVIMQTVLPKLTSDHARVFLNKVTAGNYRPDIMAQGFRIFNIFLEYLRAYDCSDGLILVIDYREANLLSIATKVNIFEIRQFAKIVMEGYGARLKAIHFMTSSFIINIMVAIFKKVVTAKIGNRIHVHKDLESLHRVFEKDVLPVEYGGQERPMQTLYEDWIKELSLDSFKEYLRDVNGAGVDETLRQKEAS